jgi:hypothetical protein
MAPVIRSHEIIVKQFRRFVTRFRASDRAEPEAVLFAS